MNEENLINYYNKFNEDKRLTRRHGIVEYEVAMKYVHEYLPKNKKAKIMDVGAGTGKYSVALAKEGHEVTALELVKHNLMTLKAKDSNVLAYLGNATNLKRFKSDYYDLVLLFGPMYHLIKKEEKVWALMEAKRIVKPDGVIMISYYMNDYCVITHGFKDNNIKKAINEGLLDKDYHIISKDDDLYSMVRTEDIDELNHLCGLKRIKILAQDGPADYLRPIINKMDEETFKLFIDYHLSTCERKDLIGASSHVLDIVRK